MSRYIEREAVMKTARDGYHSDFGKSMADLTSLREVLEDTPAADVVDVVRCKDCAVPHNRWTGCPKLNGLVTPPDFYCSYGERKKECKECPEN